MGDIANGDTEYSYALCRYQGNISSKDGVARDRTEVTIVDNGFFPASQLLWPGLLAFVLFLFLPILISIQALF